MGMNRNAFGYVVMSVLIVGLIGILVYYKGFDFLCSCLGCGSINRGF